MDFILSGIDNRVDSYEIKDALAKILHSDAFPMEEGRPVNFKVALNPSEAEGIRNNGTGVLTVPNAKIGNKLLEMIRRRELHLKLYNRCVYFRKSDRRPPRGTVETLSKVPYQDPSIERELDEKREQLQRALRIDKLQFGIWRRRPGQLKSQRGSFAVEWEGTYTSVGNALIRIEYDHKLVRIQLGDPALDTIAHNVVIKFMNIRHMWIGYDYGNPYICFDTFTPAEFQCEWFNRELSGIIEVDSKKFRQRLGAIDDHHKLIATYAHHVRVTLYRDEDLVEFVRMCNIAELRAPVEAGIDAEKYGYFTSKRLKQVERWLEGLPWAISFQVEALLHNGLLNIDDVLQILKKPISDLVVTNPNEAGDVLRYFVQNLPMKPAGKPILDFFRSMCSKLLHTTRFSLPGGLMHCYHVTFTPTRMTLEGPYAIQSNRVIRQYPDFHDHFLRVDFRDEDRLVYKWDRDVDGTTFLQERVGGILKDGFTLAGRSCQFLAYSTSALREHAVWFMIPFLHPTEGFVDAARIRRNLGDFSEDLNCPARYAARLAQAFTATDPSVRISESQWEMMPDMGKEPYLFTDGVGTISRQLAHLTWESLCKARKVFDISQLVTPDAFQIRFLGFKGVVCVDNQLQGVKMRLRESMRKFDVRDVAEADIEIARAFFKPGQMYLNRPLVMLLEDLGVKKDVFLALQENAVADARLAQNSVKQLTSLLLKHHLDPAYGLVRVLQKLCSLGLDLNHRDPAKTLNNYFMDRIIYTAINVVLRDIKHRCRIPVPNSWSLVGVADEGQAYIERGYKAEDVFTLGEGEIYASIQTDPNSEPMYLERSCTISRSPSLHPGDVQRVWAVGKPPPEKVCFFRNLKNVVVLPSVGDRSLASCLGGGDLDGDEYNICLYPPLFTMIREAPADYLPVKKRNIDIEELRDPKTKAVDEELVIPHVTDFIVEYINSDVLGLLADNHLIRADQSSEGVFDRGCLKLAKLCSQAVDYPKNGLAIDIKDSPYRLIPYKPDWKKGEDEDPRITDFYQSERALGYLYRAIEIASHPPENAPPGCSDLTQHPIYLVLNRIIDKKVRGTTMEQIEVRIRPIFRRYYDELRYICTTHTLTDYQDAMLEEEEIVIGTILAQCSQRRWRQDRIFRMRLHAENLVKETKAEFLQFSKRIASTIKTPDMKETLTFAWGGWQLTMGKLADPKSNPFGLNSFALIALNVILDCLSALDQEHS